MQRYVVDFFKFVIVQCRNEHDKKIANGWILLFDTKSERQMVQKYNENDFIKSKVFLIHLQIVRLLNSIRYF